MQPMPLTPPTSSERASTSTSISAVEPKERVDISVAAKTEHEESWRVHDDDDEEDSKPPATIRLIPSSELTALLQDEESLSYVTVVTASSSLSSEQIQALVGERTGTAAASIISYQQERMQDRVPVLDSPFVVSTTVAGDCGDVAEKARLSPILLALGHESSTVATNRTPHAVGGAPHPPPPSGTCMLQALLLDTTAIETIHVNRKSWNFARDCPGIPLFGTLLP